MECNTIVTALVPINPHLKSKSRVITNVYKFFVLHSIITCKAAAITSYQIDQVKVSSELESNRTSHDMINRLQPDTTSAAAVLHYIV